MKSDGMEEVRVALYEGIDLIGRRRLADGVCDINGVEVARGDETANGL